MRNRYLGLSKKDSSAVDPFFHPVLSQKSVLKSHELFFQYGFDGADLGFDDAATLCDAAVRADVDVLGT